MIKLGSFAEYAMFDWVDDLQAIVDHLREAGWNRADTERLINAEVDAANDAYEDNLKENADG